MKEFIETIPVENRETARNALTAAFGAAPLAGLKPVVGGASGALIYRIEVGSKSYLMRIETRRDAFRNPHQYTCMQAAAEANIAAPLRHVDPASGVAIMDFLPQRSLSEYPGGAPGLARALGSLIARLQATEPFPKLRDYFVILERMLTFLRGSGRFAAGLFDRHAEAFERIRQVYPWDDSALVSSHNDPNPRNIIFDGERLWLIDWESAYRNDPLTDMAILADNFGSTPDLEEALLESWLGHAPDRLVRARLTLMRPLTRLFYAGVLLSLSAAVSRSEPDTDLAAPSPAEFSAAIAEGRLKPGAPETMYTLGKMCLAGFLHGATARGMEDACAVVQHG
jgi:tRNA A-37 threonylcarbamoyl transferase component Bud32